MKNGFVIFLAAFVVLLASWSAFVLGPQLQLGGAKQVAVLNSSDVYPINRPGEANQGLQVYRANGCAGGVGRRGRYRRPRADLQLSKTPTQRCTGLNFGVGATAR